MNGAWLLEAGRPYVPQGTTLVHYVPSSARVHSQGEAALKVFTGLPAVRTWVGFELMSVSSPEVIDQDGVRFVRHVGHFQCDLAINNATKVNIDLVFLHGFSSRQEPETDVIMTLGDLAYNLTEWVERIGTDDDIAWLHTVDARLMRLLCEDQISL